MLFSTLVALLLQSAPTCEVQLLDAGAGDFRDTYERRIFGAVDEVSQMSYGVASQKRTTTQVFFKARCAEVATRVGKAVGAAPDAVLPLTWQAPADIVVAAAPLAHAEADIALLKAVDAKDLEAVKAALAQGADVDALGKPWKREPLHTAIEGDQVQLVELLLSHGARADGRFADGAVMFVAAGRANAGVIRALLAHGGSAEPRVERWGRPICTAAGHADVVKLLLAAGAKPNGPCFERGSDSGPPLQLAASRGSLESVQALVAAGAAIDAGALTLAGKVEVAQYLIERGAKVDGVDQSGYTPLQAHAMLDPNAEIVSLLLDHGAKPDVRNSEGLAAIHIAAGNGAGGVAIAEALANHKADLNLKTRRPYVPPRGLGDEPRTLAQGATALDLAAFIGRDEMVEALTRLGSKRAVTKPEPQ